MAEPPTTIDEYIAQFPPEVRERLETVRDTIRAVAPEATERIAYGMPAFNGRRIFLYFGVSKHHIGIYPTAEGIEAFRDRFDQLGLRYSKGAVQLPNTQPLPVDLIRDIAAHRVAQDAARAR